ncbi:hypothetical protein [Motilibacter aurantiacus]|nr:hypothetical protein [Motilibacter aurantiacus]
MRLVPRDRRAPAGAGGALIRRVPVLTGSGGPRPEEYASPPVQPAIGLLA